jgi:hypothetical protein
MGYPLRKIITEHLSDSFRRIFVDFGMVPNCWVDLRREVLCLSANVVNSGACLAEWETSCLIFNFWNSFTTPLHLIFKFFYFS